MAKAKKGTSTGQRRTQAHGASRSVIWPDPKPATSASYRERTNISAASGAVIADTNASMHEALKRLADK